MPCHTFLRFAKPILCDCRIAKLGLSADGYRSPPRNALGWVLRALRSTGTQEKSIAYVEAMDRTERVKETIITRILLGVGILAVVASLVAGLLVSRLYCSTCRIEIGQSPDLVEDARFAEAIFEGDRSIRVRLGRGTTLLSIQARGGSPQEAADRANGAVARIRSTLARQRPVTVEVIDPAEPGIRAVAPNGQLALVVGVAGIIAVFMALRLRRRIREAG